MTDQDPSPSHKEESPFLAGIESRTFDTTGRFWLEPTAIQKVTDIINTTQFGSMFFGAATRQPEATEFREELRNYFSGVRANPDDIGSAFDFGYVYGSLVATYSSGKETMTDTVGPVFESRAQTSLNDGLKSAFRIDTARGEVDAISAFLCLRNLEIALCNSDILGFGLSCAQDHISNIFYSQQDAETYTSAQLYLLQTIFYAGALVGAVGYTSEADRSNPPIELLRAPSSDGESVSVVISADEGDRLAEDIEYQLSNKLHFDIVGPLDDPVGVRITKGGVQYGPNARSLPIGFLSDGTENATTIPISQIVGYFQLGEQDAGTQSLLSMCVSPTEIDKNAQIKGILLDGGVVVGAYYHEHANAHALMELASHMHGDNIAYADGFTNTITDDTLIDKVANLYLPLTALAIGGVALIQNVGYWFHDIAALTQKPSFENASPMLLDAAATSLVGWTGLKLYGMFKKNILGWKDELHSVDAALQGLVNALHSRRR